MSARLEPAIRRPNLVMARREVGHPEDAVLVRALAARDPSAPAAVWHKHAPRVFRVVARVLGPGADAEDLTQDVFERVFAKVGELRDPEALGSFIFSIALRVLKWELRKRRVRRVLQLSEAGDLPDVAVPEVDAEGRQAVRHLYAILDTLSTGERTAFILRHMEGMSLPEVADAMGLSLATVKRRLVRALDRVTAAVERGGSLAAYASTTPGKEARHDS